ncbi:MAG: hypothetical protein QGG36_03880 [Pirellulaceae bacterium]|jgi:hypothetical protein|nr:hypothetical protein [Pirellulaceae bacterium]MDP7014919.1 hypothetical protein [Pirellulaceae bacterium]
MAHSTPERGVLARYFAGVTESTFQTQLGVVDPPLVDYVSDLLCRFVHSDTIHRIRNLTGKRVASVAQMAVEANQRIGLARRDVHRHIGDFTLFWTGLFPEALERRQKTGDSFHDYCAQGKRAYLIAATIETDEEQDAPGELLERLGVNFELCAYGLREVRREWEEEGDSTNSLLLD